MCDTLLHPHVDFMFIAACGLGARSPLRRFLGMTADGTGLERAHKQPHFLFSVIFDCTGGIFKQPRSDAPSGIAPHRVNYRKDAIWKIKQLLKHKNAPRVEEANGPRRVDDPRHKLALSN